MTRIVFAAAAAAAAAWLLPEAAYADETVPLGGALPASAIDLPSGVRSEEAAGGFQLVVHGTWPSAVGDVSDRSDAHDTALDIGAPPLASRGLALPSSFRRSSYLPHVYAAEARFGLPAGLLDAVIWTESRYNPAAVSRVGAAGLGQLMPGTARELGVLNRFDPRQNVAGAARYLRQMLDRFGAIHLALAAYNAGPAAVQKAGGIPRNGETPGYVQSVLRSWRR